MEELQQWDEQIVLAVNALHTPNVDAAMLLMTQTTFWTPLFLLIIYQLFKKFSTRDAWFMLVGVAVAILVSDQTTSGLMKPFFERLRPTHQPGLSEHLHVVKNYRGGLYGFASSHAANSFALACVLFALVRTRIRGIMWLFLWATFMSFSRLYLGVHYLTDLIAGAIVGLVAGWIGYRLVQYLQKKFGGEPDAATKVS
jgi:undecaprenyl-diphosphatase